MYIFTLGECRAPPCHTVVLPAHCTTGPGRGSHVRCMGGIPEPFSETGLSLLWGSHCIGFQEQADPNGQMSDN